MALTDNRGLGAGEDCPIPAQATVHVGAQCPTGGEACLDLASRTGQPHHSLGQARKSACSAHRNSPIQNSSLLQACAEK